MDTTTDHICTSFDRSITPGGGGGLWYNKDGGVRRPFQGLKNRFFNLLAWLASKGTQRKLLQYFLGQEKNMTN